MNNAIELLNRFSDECVNFVGTLDGFEAAIELANYFGVSQISYSAFLNGKLVEEKSILTLESNENNEYIEVERESPTKERLLVVRIFLKNSPKELSSEDSGVLNIFANVILSQVTTYCLYVARKNTYLQETGGLTNKVYYLEHVEKIIESGKQSEYYYGHLNIKNATKFNAIFGNDITDRIIIQYGIELSNKCDKELNENVSRLGGDNFAFVIHEKNINNFIEVIKSVTVSLNNNDDIITHIVNCRCGIIQGNSNIYNSGELLSCATNIYKLTRRGNKDIKIGDATNNAANYDSPTFLNELIYDLKSEKLLVYYQPIVKSKEKDEIVGAEALVRWRRSGELLLPHRFLPLAEKMGFITDIDLFVLRKGCETIAKWVSEGKKVVPICFNFSHHDFSTYDISNEIIEIVDFYKIDRNLVIIELKEADYLEEHEILLHASMKLREAGIRVAIDSFGSGYASISLLKKFNLNFMKLESSLVNDTSEKANIIIKNLINLAHDLSMVVVCQGITDKERIDQFKEKGNYYFQSEYFEKALSERFFSNKLK